MTYKMSDTDQTVTVYNLRADTSEFIGKGDAFIPASTGLPAYCTTVKPPEPAEGFIAIFNAVKQKWSLLEDHRGEVVFSTESGQTIAIMEPGAYPSGTTTIAPENPWQKWDGKAWVTDESAERAAMVDAAEAERKTLLSLANEAISTLQDAVDFDMATDDEKQSLVAFKKYRVLLSRVKPEDAPGITWPEVPEYVA